MKAILTALLLGSAMTTVHAHAQRFERTTGGVKVTPAGGSAASVEVSVHGDGIIHVVTTPKGAGTAPRAQA